MENNGHPWLGIVGNGQLGRMLAMAAHQLGVNTLGIAPSASIADDVTTDCVHADWRDVGALAEAAARTSVVTYEMEMVPIHALEAIKSSATLHPTIEAIRDGQDRAREKALLERAGIPLAPWHVVNDAGDIENAALKVGFPAILKASRGGYDGRGQRVVSSVDDLREAWQSMGTQCVLERKVTLLREVSVIAVRAVDGDFACYDLAENVHAHGILRRSTVPAAVSENDAEMLRGWVHKLMDLLGYVGVLTLELFQTPEGWLANEIAPRVHNSGHWTIEGAETSQFENHVRAVLGWPLGSTASRGHCAMLNVIGEFPDHASLLRVPGLHLHDYGKTPKSGRKVGHLTLCCATRQELDELVELVERRLKAKEHLTRPIADARKGV